MSTLLNMQRVPLIAAIILAAATSSARAQGDPAQTLFVRGDFPAAAAAYATLLQANPSDEDAQLGLAAILLYANDLQDAKPLLGSVLATDSGNARATRLLNELVRREAEADRPTSVAGGETRVPFVTAAPLPVVRVVANGVATNFFVDTGADVELDPSFAAKLGVKTQAAGSGTFAGGHQAAIRSGILNSLALGDATASDVPVHVIPIHASLFFPKLQVDGIIGTTYFERFLVTIDYPHNQLILRPRSAQVSAAFQARAAASGAAIVQCYLVGDHFVMAQAQVNDASPGLFLFDSGLAGGGLMPSADLIKAAGITLNETAASTGYGGAGALTAVPFIADRVAVGSAVQRNIAGIYTPQGSPFGLFTFAVWGAVSNDFLRNYEYTVDFDAMRIVLAPPAMQ